MTIKTCFVKMYIKVFTILLLVMQVKHVTSYVNNSELLPYLESSGSTLFYFADGGYVSVNLQQNFKFLSTTYSKVHIGGDGYITFGNGGFQYPTWACAGSSVNSVPTIAVYLADSDNSYDKVTAKLLYRQDTSTLSQRKVSRDVFAAFPDLEGNVTLLNWRFVVTWYNIPSCCGTNYLEFRNTYQAILTRDVSGSHSFLVMYYSNITWPELKYRRNPARVGIYCGSSVNVNNFYLVPGSCTYSLLNIGEMSNFDQPGKFVFKIDTAVQLPKVSKCFKSNEKRVVNILFKPNIVSIIGKQNLLVYNLKICLDNAIKSIFCSFNDNRNRQKPQKVEGLLLFGQSVIVCPTPDFYFSLGKVKVEIQMTFIYGEKLLASGYVYVVKTNYNRDEVSLEAVQTKNPLALRLSARWDKLDVKQNELELKEKFSRWGIKWSSATSNLNLTLMELVGSSWRKLETFENIPNSGRWTNDSLSIDLQRTLVSDRLENPPRLLSVSTHALTQTGVKLWVTRLIDSLDATVVLGKLKNNQTDMYPNIYDKKCQQWHDHEPLPPTDAFSCPFTLEQAADDWRFSLDLTDISTSKVMNPNNYTIYLQRVPSPSGAGSQCSYDNQGDIIHGYTYGSRMHRHSPNSWKHHWDHYWDDIMPYIQCCELSYKKEDNCRQFYFSKRPYQSSYVPPVPFRASGATHISTFEGMTYLLLDNTGTFVLLKYGNVLEIQILAEGYKSSQARIDTTVITSTVIKSVTENSTYLKFQVSANSSNGLLIWLDDQPLNFYRDNLYNMNHDYLEESYTLYHEGVNVFVNGTSEALFSFSSGFSIKLMLSAGNQSLNIIGSVSPTCLSNITGLLGNYSGNFGFVERWRIPKNESLFQFPPGKTYENYNNFTVSPSYQPSRDDVLKSIPARVKTFCGNVEDCQVDYVLTNNEEFAKTSTFAYEQFDKLVNASKIISDHIKCTKPSTIKYGTFFGSNFTVGASIQLNCDIGYYLRSTNKTLLQDRFVCTPTNHVTSISKNATTDLAIWLSQKLRQPLTNLSVECIPMEKDKAKQLTTMKTIPKIISVFRNQSVTLEVAGKIDMGHILEIACVFTSATPAIHVETHGDFVIHDVNNTEDTVMAICRAPILSTLGKINVKLTIKYMNKPPVYFETHVWSQKLPQDEEQLHVSVQHTEKTLAFSWDTSIFENYNTSNCNFSLDLFQADKFWRETCTITSEICNTGSFNVSISPVLSSLKTISNYDIFSKPTILALRAASDLYATGYLSSIVVLHDVILAGSNKNAQHIELSENQQIPGIPDFDLLCRQWFEKDELFMHAKSALPCPRSAASASIDWRFRESDQESLSILNPNSSVVYVESLPYHKSKVSMVCAYNEAGNLMVGAPSGSRVYEWSNDWLNHYTHDTMPYLYCCKWSKNEDNCRNYFYAKRGIQINGMYKVPKFAHIWGAGHFYTFDNLIYRLNGTGDFWMIKSEVHTRWNQINKFECQVSLESYTSAWGNQDDIGQAPKVSVITAFAIHQVINEDKVTIQVMKNHSGDFQFFLDGDLLDSNEINEFYHDHVNLFFNHTSAELLAVFQYGFSFKFKLSGANETGMNTFVSASMEMNKTSTVGLLGNLDGIKNNDFVTPLGSHLPANSSVEDIHLQFGMKWLVQQNESLFTSDEDLSKPDRQPVRVSTLFQHPTLPSNKIREICQDSAECVFDALATGSEIFAASGKVSQDTFQNILNISALSSAPECAYPDQLKQDEMQSILTVGSVIQVVCDDIDNFEENITFTCVDQGNNTLEWISLQNEDLSLETCLSANEPLKTSQVSAGNLNDFKDGALILLSLVIIILFIAVCILAYHVITRQKYSALEATYRPPMANNLLELELNDFINN